MSYKNDPIQHSLNARGIEKQKAFATRTFPIFTVSLRNEEHFSGLDEYKNRKDAAKAARKHLTEYPCWDKAQVVEFDGNTPNGKVIQTIKQKHPGPCPPK